MTNAVGLRTGNQVTFSNLELRMSVVEVHKAIEQNKIAADSGNEASLADGFNPFRGIQKRKFFSFRTLSVICIWYLFSFIALFLSKHILDIYQVDLLFFSGIQLFISALMSFLHGLIWFRKDEKAHLRESPNLTIDFYFSMGFIGVMRLLVIYLGLMSMKYVALSFMETVKSSAPLFTLLISFIVLKEKNGLLVQLSIFPIMVGLVLCSAFEISFTWVGFLAAMGANVAECLQFVLSKIFLGVMNPSDFQQQSSIAGLLSAIPLSFFIFDYEAFRLTSNYTFGVIVLIGFCYYCQTLMAWILMEFLSPVTHSICNTVKCGVAVWLSVPIFGNVITLWSGFGSSLVIAGVIMYQKARSYERRSLKDLMDPAVDQVLPSSVDVIHSINS